MYILKKGSHIAKTDKEWKRDAFIAHGFELIEDDRKKEVKKNKTKKSEA